VGKAIIVDNVSKKYDISKLRKETQFRELLSNLVKRVISREHKNTVEIWALKNLSFSVEEGEIVGIIGRNGAGKSTLLKILSKISYPTTGMIRVNGRIGSLLEVGTGFHWELSGRDNVFLNGSILGMTRKEVKSKLDEIIAFADVEKFMDTPIKRYSSGMRLRLGFSVAAHLDTDILFVDEVLSVGDVGFQKKCEDKMKELRNSGRTVIFVSHMMPTVESLCPRVLWIENGEIREDGRTADVIENYLALLRDKKGADIPIPQFEGLNHPSEFDLTNMPHREGGGEIRFTGMEFLDLQERPKVTVQSGDSVKVRLYYTVHKPAAKPEFYFRIRNEIGEKVATMSTSLSGHELPTLYPGQGYVDLDIDFLNINPDRYYITVYAINTTDREDGETICYDSIERCAVLDVSVSDYYGSGKGIDKYWGVMFLPCKWSFNGIKSDVH
jgi:lipopolysaccharide transport system ATP-binding protein